MFVIVCLGLQAQEANIVQYSISQGLPQSQVNKIFFDSRGMLWSATSGGGISSFDGLNFTTFNESNGLAGNIVLDIEEDNDGRIICVSSWGGISFIENNNVVKIIKFTDDFNLVNAIEKDAYGRIWVVGNKVGYLENDELKFIDTDLTLPFVNKPNIRTFSDEIYVTTNNKLIIIDAISLVEKRVKTYPYNLNLAINFNDKLYLGTEKNGVIIDDNGTTNQCILPKSKVKSEIDVTDFLVENSSKLWITTKSGVYNIDNDIVNYYSEDKGIAEYELTSACFDAQGNVWFGSSGEGLISIVNTPFSFYSKTYGLNKSDNYGILEDEKGRIWVANNEEGIFVKDNNVTHHLTTKNGLASNSVRILKSDNNGNVWAGTKEGLSVISEDFKIRNIDSFSGVSIKSILINDEEVYVGTQSKGIWLVSQNNSVRLFSTKIKNAYSLALDPNHNIVIGTNNGCFIKSNGEYSLRTEAIKNTFISNITFDRNGNLWVGTDRSISRWDGDHFVNYDISDGLTSDLVYILFSDHEGFLWVGTNKGLDRVSIDANSEISKIKHYGYEEGFKGVEVNSKGYYLKDNGEIFFSTVQGLHKYNPIYDYNYSYNTPVYISDIKLFLEPVDELKLTGEIRNWFGIPSSLILETNENHLTFDFFAVDYLNPNGVTYTYFLEGFDKQWSPPTSSRYAVYSNLPPGSYKFNVKQYGNDFSQVASLNFRIKKPPPPFYRTFWFLLICLILFIVVVYYFTEYRTAKLKSQQAFLEAKIEERTQLIKESEMEKTVLLQEVHHRVKNNLQIIISLFRLQTHFTDNEEAIDLFKNSQNRIRSMSKIHEKLYETKDLSKVEIKTYVEELVSDLVTSYDINNSVSIKSNIQNCFINLTELTPLALIINEMITNSLKYGLKEIENPEIFISLKQSVVGDTVLIVSDNGKGFDESIWNNHHTMGVELIKTLTEQLDGTIELTQDSGHPVYTLKFKATL